ncbi:hypothetical protein C5C41_07310 [Rathayibacter sp. AY1E9]|jgi:hypothetical protein|uniref:hypothetical protein n=1 Tax=unclassified Rathayibacter TaxID=2609250 RepID=UPI000CE86D42|nr:MULTISPECIES: hypothetical protein [unclassified Rathayibacter]PPF32173.1 hypothetical protein C5C10_13030 [Rathayibacter sp. AY1A3]PPF70135.1 hypothetical protein C5C46_12445 [Rathayibacter sp. AY1E6]PPG10772.1 hypothetical protein C5C26_02035 [Rathayibacter sp. AY2B1]PPG28903.1 hypothetical protein C5C25_11015 [Rathayibacter sp. AY2B9]PPG53281.1 hypothetical protein C5C41_07310 [Rathayibacter sp. AY1E9]
MGLREDAEELVREHRRAAARTDLLDPWSDPETPEWCTELAAALWQGSFRPSPVYFRREESSHAWRGPHSTRLHHLGYGWQLTAHREQHGVVASETAVVLETGSLWRGLGIGRRPVRALRGRLGVEGLQAGHDVHFAVRGIDERSDAERAERRLLFGVAGLAALIEDDVHVGPHGELDWSV